MLTTTTIVTGLVLLSCSSSNFVSSRQNLRTYTTQKTTATQTSVLWGQNGEKWDPNTSLLRDFTNVGYMQGNQPIPKYPVWVNVVDYGATPDDDISDVQAFRDAIEACPEEYAVYVPKGRYIIDEPLVISKSKIAIRGESRDKAVLFFPKHLNEVQGTIYATDYFIRFEGGNHRGLEDLSIVFRDEQKGTGYFLDPNKDKQADPHWYYVGERAIFMGYGETNSWLRNLYIKNSNYAIDVSSPTTMYISVIDIVIDQFHLRMNPKESTVSHMSIHVHDQAKYCLFHNIRYTAKHNHEFSVMGARDCVFSRITGPDLQFDHHAQGNANNLFTEAETGVGGRWYGDDINNFNETYWCIKGINPLYYLPKDENPVIVGVVTDEPTSIGPTWHLETIDPYKLEPANIYLAQMQTKPGKWILPHNDLTLPPLPFKHVFQLLPVDDGGVIDKVTANRDYRAESYGWRTIINLSGYKEGYAKFDLDGLGLKSDVASAKLKVYVKGVANPPFGLEALEVVDNSWSENDLNWYNRPQSSFSVALAYIYETTPLPAFIELDVTDYLNQKIASGDRFMSLHLKTGGAEHNKYSFTDIPTKEGGNPLHLVIQKYESTIPPPSAPTSLVAYSGNDRIHLDWTDNTEFDFASYNVYRHDGSGNYVREAMGLTTSEYTDFTVWDDITYTYVVTAVDIANTESLPSPTVSTKLGLGKRTTTTTSTSTTTTTTGTTTSTGSTTSTTSTVAQTDCSTYTSGGPCKKDSQCVWAAGICLALYSSSTTTAATNVPPTTTSSGHCSKINNGGACKKDSNCYWDRGTCYPN